ncbi:BrnT family toxin [Cyanobacterium sp. DS4]|uniref:BrnT family toxin n=1 Tax=Cyanobacterium sp. DS4 TaxID=2878255 RepID=UPI002E7FB97A|nr:BrnT family toxin [Cyanobacterium sp. Dongsha4]WVL00267.1 BrnT family toxin [Cyanobacterium sp. Dongsha4]
MNFEWDINKNISNQQKHGITFEEAQSIFDDLSAIIFEDDRFAYGELRFIIIGQIYLETLNKYILGIVVYTERADKIRIISARKASKQERKLYE